MHKNDFSRNRKLDVVTTVGTVLHMCANGNTTGYSITAQNFFSELGKIKEAPCKQSVSEARSKLSYKAFEYLLGEAYSEDLDKRWHGFRVLIADGTTLTLPKTKEILQRCEQPQTKSGTTHYPKALMVTVINSTTGQPLTMQIGNYRESERDLMLCCLEKSQARDLWLLDRGLGGSSVYFDFTRKGVDFIHRMKTSGEQIPGYLKEFLRSKKASDVVGIPVMDEKGNGTAILIRLVKGPKDSEGKRIVFATSLLEEDIYSVVAIRELYRSRWGIETMYNRMKNLLNLEKFHARSWNGILQEIFANLLVISLASLIDIVASQRLKVDRSKALPSFKAVIHVVCRNLSVIVGKESVTNVQAKALAEKIIVEAMQIIHRKRPGRNYPRISMQPIKTHNLCKKKKLNDYYEGKGA